jgi:hypothetical protein
MEVFSCRRGPSQNIAFISIATALTLVLSVLASFVPLSGFFIIIVLPFASFVTILLTENKYGLLFLIAAPLISIAVTAYAFQETLFYIIPSLLTGALFGYLSKWHFPLAISFFLSALLSMGLTYLSLPLIKAIYEVDIINFALSLLGLANKSSIYNIVPSFIFAISLASLALAYLFGEVMNEKIQLKRNNDDSYAFFYPILSSIFASLSLGLISILPNYAFIFLAFSLFFACFSSLLLLRGVKRWLYILLGCLLLASLIGFVFLYPLYSKENGLILLSLFSFSIAIPSFIRGLELKKEEKTSIVR